MDFINKNITTRILLITIAALAIPALFYNLGLRVFSEDESIRTLVALEMLLSGNYIVPTLNDTFYYSKPPLYNWILICFFYVFGGISEWTARIPTVIFLAGYTWFIYWVNKQFISKKLALFTALAFLTCGRILFWDSMLAYIDIFYSWVSYALIVGIYYWGRSDRDNAKLFMGSMLLFSVGYMLKGFPSILFLVISAGVFLLAYRKWSYLKSRYLYLSLLIPILIIGAYYFSYSQYNDIEKTLEPLLDQSTRRTIVRYDFWAVFKHLFTYPFENIYHFLPWSLFIICCFRRDFFKVLDDNQFVRYCFYALAANLVVYWVSPEVYPRYVLMLVPLSFTVFFYFYSLDNSWKVKFLSILIKVIVVASPIAILIGIFQNYANLDSLSIVILATCLLVTVGLSLIYLRNSEHRVLLLVVLCLVIRVFFNVVILPKRHNKDFAALAKSDSELLASKYPHETIYLLGNSKLDYTGSIYLSNKRQKKTLRTKELLPSGYYLIDTSRLDFPEVGYTLLDSIRKREDKKTLYLIKTDPE